MIICVQVTSFSGYECVNCTAECKECTYPKTVIQGKKKRIVDLNAVISMYSAFVVVPVI